MASSKTSRAFTSSLCHTCRQRLLPNPRRAFSTTTALRADNPPPSSSAPDSALSGLGAISRNIARSSTRSQPTNTSSSSRYLDAIDGKGGSADSLITGAFSANLNASQTTAPHRLHIYATKHNTHITFVQPPRSAAQTTSSTISATSTKTSDQKKMVDVLLSLSTGNIGFRKAGRGSYDAAYQLAAVVLKQMQEKGMVRDVQRLEVVLRGFGAGREAVTKALLGVEGRNVRGRIVGVVDATRLKLGGPRAKKLRRLG